MAIEFREENDLTRQREELLKNCLKYINDGNKATTSGLANNINTCGYTEKSAKKIIPELREIAENKGLLRTEKVSTDSPIKAYQWTEVTDKGLDWIEEKGGSQ